MWFWLCFNQHSGWDVGKSSRHLTVHCGLGEAGQTTAEGEEEEEEAALPCPPVGRPRSWLVVVTASPPPLPMCGLSSTPPLWMTLRLSVRLRVSTSLHSYSPLSSSSLSSLTMPKDNYRSIHLSNQTFVRVLYQHCFHFGDFWHQCSK